MKYQVINCRFSGPVARHNDVLSVGMCRKMRPVGVTKKGKKGQKLSCVKLAICPDHPCRHRPLKFCVQGRVWEVVIYFKFHENRSRGLRAVGGRKSPSPVDKAHVLYNSLYYRTSRERIKCIKSTQCCLSQRSKTARIKYYRSEVWNICASTFNYVNFQL